MPRHWSHHRSQRRLSICITALAIVAIVTGCRLDESARFDMATSVAKLQTVSPDQAATLTAWPTAPAMRTRRPTFTPSPRTLWTAEALPSATASVGPPTQADRTEPVISPTPVPVDQPPPSGSQGTGQPAIRLIIRTLGLDAPVVEVSWDVLLVDGTFRSEWQTADKAVGHHRNSANPGELGNIVMSAHHNTSGEIFREVAEIGQAGARLGLGDEILLVTQDGQTYAYYIVAWDRFLEEGLSDEQRRLNAAYLDQTPDQTLTLVTCWPYDGRSHRVVVIAKPLP